MRFAYLIESPFNYRDENNQVTGCDVELAKYVSAEIDADNFEPIETEFAELLPGLVKGNWKMTTGLFSTIERKKITSFCRPIWALPDGLLIKKGNPHNLDGYRSIADSANCTLAVIRDQYQHRSAIEFGIPDERILVCETYAQAASAVKEERAGAYASVGRAHTGFIGQHPEMDLDFVPVPIVEKTPAFGCFAVAKADVVFQHSVNEILEAYIGSQQHRTLMTRFGFTHTEIDLVVN